MSCCDGERAPHARLERHGDRRAARRRTLPGLRHGDRRRPTLPRVRRGLRGRHRPRPLAGVAERRGCTARTTGAARAGAADPDPGTGERRGRSGRHRTAGRSVRCRAPAPGRRATRVPRGASATVQSVLAVAGAALVAVAAVVFIFFNPDLADPWPRAAIVGTDRGGVPRRLRAPRSPAAAVLGRGDRLARRRLPRAHGHGSASASAAAVERLGLHRPRDADRRRRAGVARPARRHPCLALDRPARARLRSAPARPGRGLCSRHDGGLPRVCRGRERTRGRRRRADPRASPAHSGPSARR